MKGRRQDRPHAIGAALILGFLCAGTGQAQTAPAPSKDSVAAADAAEEAAEAKDQILVVGHRQFGAVATEIPPEVILNSTAIRALGAADLDEVFRDLAPEIGNGPGRTGTAGAPVVLVNGQRIAGFNSIKDFPPEAVRRIEIFPSNVALQYGYAPDQRVVNVVLRSNYRALTLLGRYTLAPNNWRGLYRAKVDLIRIDDNGHWNLGLDYSHQDALYDDTTLTGPLATPGAAVPRHTLARQDDHLIASGTWNRKIGRASCRERV